MGVQALNGVKSGWYHISAKDPPSSCHFQPFSSCHISNPFLHWVVKVQVFAICMLYFHRYHIKNILQRITFSLYTMYMCNWLLFFPPESLLPLLYLSLLPILQRCFSRCCQIDLSFFSLFFINDVMRHATEARLEHDFYSIKVLSM